LAGQVLEVLVGHAGPVTLETLTREVASTRHPSRVRIALFELERQGCTRFDREGRWQACVAPPLAWSGDRHRLAALMVRSQA
jgi:hypothetical protein